MFTLPEGEPEFTFRGVAQTVRAGTTVNIPANAPQGSGGKTGHVLCMCAPARRPSELETKSSRRSKVASEEEAVCQPIADLREHHAGIDVELLRELPVDVD